MQIKTLSLINDGWHPVLHVPTGKGKSMVYLMVAALMACKWKNGEQVAQNARKSLLFNFLRMYDIGHSAGY